jgi:hypothetical protein
MHLRLGRTQDARKAADQMNLDNPQRKEVRALAASLVAEAWARTGKPKEALALLDTIEVPKKDGEQIALQMRVARIFARFAANQRGPARSELAALAADDPNQLGRFVLPQFRVHPELQKLARSVFEQHPSARKHIKAQTRRRNRCALAGSRANRSGLSGGSAASRSRKSRCEHRRERHTRARIRRLSRVRGGVARINICGSPPIRCSA